MLTVSLHSLFLTEKCEKNVKQLFVLTGLSSTEMKYSTVIHMSNIFY